MTESTAPAVTVERLPDHVALVTINRPDARNAVNGDVARGLDAAIRDTDADDDVWVVILTGAGTDAFSAGADLKAVSSGRGAELRTERGGFAGFVHAPKAKPWIAAVNGPALAGGCELVLACDLVVAVPLARFGLPEVKRGLIASAGGLYRLPRALPPAVAREMILTGEPISAERAHALGMVNQLAPDAARLLATARALAARITVNAPVAVRESLAVARLAVDGTDAELRQKSEEGQARNMASQDYQEGPRAFIEKRAPRWTGR
jgi:enoyl-CoA hydratase/carnithine racemase